MKKLLLLSLAFIIGLAVVAQRPQIKNGVFVRNYKKDQKVTIEPVEKISPSAFTAKHSGLKNGNNTNIVTVLDLGTSANVLGYSSGSRTMVWADDDLNCIINFHRAGPGATPPSLSGYYATDLGVNMGASQADWTNQILSTSATMVSSPYYYDASRYPCAAIYNPAGNTTLANAYCAFFGPNFANLVVSGFGGYTIGRMNLVNHADTTKRIKWYNPTPYTYIPDGFTIAGNYAYMVDGDNNVESGSVVYQDSVIYGRGVWNTTTKDFDYTYKQIAFHTKDMYNIADNKIAASPDGQTMYMSVLGNDVNGSPLIDSTYYPIVRKSTDGGLTWGEPKAIQLDGPNGIAAIKNCYSDYFLANFFTPPTPSRDEIPYTCAFEHNISVDYMGNPHIAVAVGYAPGGYSISSGVDSLINVFDIYSINGGTTWQGVFLGSLKTFRGTWATYTSDNRVYIARNKVGDKMFVTWNDTHIDGETNNQNPDVWARGFDLKTNKLTTDNGVNGGTNVTFLCDITQEAYWQCTSPIIFTDNNKYTIPICTQWFADAAADSKFKYIPDFSYVDSDFTLLVPNPGVGVDQKQIEIASVNVYPNPVKDIAKVSLSLTQNANVTVEVTNLVGKQMMSLNKGNMSSGSQQFSIDATNLTSGIYFVTVIVNGQKYTQKMIVE
ncbi:MAG: T9SS type A sorting domain-containing protein [Bacteroidetes bacterium]|nr:T9SS type A sorting domain-containing protein [Bacteroidota bacterium]